MTPGSKWEPLRNASKQKFNELVESTKAAARSHVGLMITAWNDAVKQGGEKLTVAIESLWKLAPYGKVTGVYRYEKNKVDPGDPGWELGKSVHIYQFMPFAVSTSYGLEEIEIKAAADLDALVAGASAEVITKLQSQFTLEAYAKLPHQLDPPMEPLLVLPFPPETPNKPASVTGFQGSLATGMKVSSNISAFLKIDSWVDMGPLLVDLGALKGEIEKGKFKKVAENK